MSSQPKTIAGRANAKASTGPKTASGKAHASQNARRHGLSVPIFANPARSAELDNLALAIAGQDACAAAVEYARRVAEAQIDLRRVREARLDLLTSSLSDPNYKPHESKTKRRKRVRSLIRFLREVDRMTQSELEMPHVAAFADSLITKVPRGSKKFLHVLTDLTRELTAMDRYERRALSRRKFAIRELDALRRQPVASLENCSTDDHEIRSIILTAARFGKTNPNSPIISK